MTIESGDTVHLRAASPPLHKPRRRPCSRRCCLPCSLCLILLLVIGIVLLVLGLTVLKPKDPTIHLVSSRVTGVSPNLTFSAVNVQLNVTLELDILVHNPNPAKFKHEGGATQLLYRDAQVGVADVEPGTIPSRGSTHVMLALTVQAEKFAAEIGNLASDLTNEEVAFDARTRIPGRVTILGMFKHHAVALSQCHVVIGFPDLKVKQQDCTQDNKL